MTVEDSDLALPQTLPEIFEAAATGKVSLEGSPATAPKIRTAAAGSAGDPGSPACIVPQALCLHPFLGRGRGCRSTRPSFPYWRVLRLIVLQSLAQGHMMGGQEPPAEPPSPSGLGGPLWGPEGS